MKPLNIYEVIHPIIEGENMTVKVRVRLEDKLMRSLKSAEDKQFAYYRAYVKFLQERVTETEKQMFNARYLVHYEKEDF